MYDLINYMEETIHETNYKLLYSDVASKINDIISYFDYLV